MIKDIDEAITHAEEVAEINDELARACHTDENVYMEEEAKCFECAAEHRQLAEWLRELKSYKSALKEGCQICVKNGNDGWISPKVALPENKSYVLVTIRVPGRQPHVRSSWYQDGFFMNDNGDTWKKQDKEVVGWMYSPEPMGKSE